MCDTKIRTVYLVDFENVHSDGLDGIEELDKEDEVYLFYTKNADTIDIRLIDVLRNLQASVHTFEVASGKQALDNQLDSYLGYLIGVNNGQANYVIVSKDKGFEVIRDFWVDHNISLRGTISESPVQDPEPQTEQVQPKQQHKPKAKKAAAPEKKTASMDKSALNSEIQKTLSRAKLDSNTINSTASIVSNNIFEKSGKQTVYREIIKKHKQKRGLEIYNLIKPIIKKI